MGIIDQKRDFFSKLAAVNALSEIPKGLRNSSYSSVNNSTNSTDFLVDITTALVGAKALKDYVVDVLTYRLPQIELAIKDGLKLELKELVSCNVNPSIPTWFQNGGTGVELKITDIDAYDIMKVNPQSFEGNLIYTDVPAGLNSTDFNTYLYNTIQTPGIATNWGLSVTNSVDILESTFTPNGTTNNNVIKYTTSSSYSNKKLTDFNNDFIDTLSLFGNPTSLDSPKVVTLILEELFGSISSSPGVNKSKKQIELELKFNEVLDCILESEDDNITDSFFTFDNPTLARIDRESNNRRNGIRELETCGNLAVQVTSQAAADSVNTISSATTKTEEVKAVTEALDNIVQLQASFSPTNTNDENIGNNFFIEIVRKLQRIIMSAIMTPEFISLFAINHQIIYGQGTSYDGPIDFLKKNRKLVKGVAKVLLNILLTLLLDLVLLYLSRLLKKKFADDEIEKAKNYVSILLSYVGVPQSVIAQIRRIAQ